MKIFSYQYLQIQSRSQASLAQQSSYYSKLGQLVSTPDYSQSKLFQFHLQALFLLQLQLIKAYFILDYT
jgi:hypothetical protein